MIKDIAGNVLKVGDKVYYARKHPYRASGLLVEKTITGFLSGFVQMDKMTSTSPSTQLIKK